MLTIRNAQLRALADHDLQEFQETISDLLQRKFPELLGGLPGEYLDRLVSAALATCIASGFDHQGSIVEFAESLVMNSSHPMTAAVMAAQCQSVLSDFRAQVVFLKLQALAASLAPPPAQADAQSETAADPVQE